jgi:hypothetical protein
MVRIAHVMRGRLRLRLDALKGQPALATRLHEQLAAVAGVCRVEVKYRTGSVLISYDPRALGSADFIDDLSAAMGTLFPAHFAPGRARIRVDLLKGRPRLAQTLERQLVHLAGIHRLRIDSSDGACHVVYDSRQVTSPEFMDAVSRSMTALLPRLNVTKIIGR